MWKRTVGSPAGLTEKAAFTKFAVGAKGAGARGVLAGDSVNCEAVDGVLRTGVGAVAYELDWDPVRVPSNMTNAETFFTVQGVNADGERETRFGVVSWTGSVYLYNRATGAFAFCKGFSDRVQVLAAYDRAGERVTVLCCADGVFTLSVTGEVAATEVVSASPAACWFQGRVFCVEKPYTVRYCAPYAPTDFAETIDGGGRIAFPEEAGEIVALVPMKGRIYAFYEYGICALEVAGGASGFRFEKIAYTGGRICENSVSVVGADGGKAFFLAADGLYAFDGNKAWRVCKNLSVLPIRGDHVCGHAEFEGKYFLRYTGADGAWKAVVVDAESEEGYFAFVPTGVSVCDGVAYCAYGLAVQKFRADGDLPSGEKYTFSVSGQTFGEAGLKTLKRLRFFGEGKFSLTVASGGKEKTFSVGLENGRAEVKPSLRGKEFSLVFVLEKGAILRGVEAETERCAGLKG